MEDVLSVARGFRPAPRNQGPGTDLSPRAGWEMLLAQQAEKQKERGFYGYALPEKQI